MISKLKARVGYFVSPPIIQFSPPRTGSTLLWNTIRVCFPDKEVKKSHKLGKFEKKYRNAPIVASIRNPLDSISSSIQRYGRQPTEDVVRQQIKEYENQGMWDILEIRNKPKVKILRYEDFAFDFKFMFSELEEFFQTPIPETLKTEVNERYSIDKVKKKSEDYGDFANYDKEDQIHGKHISQYSGASGYYKDYLGEDQIQLVYTHFKEVFDAFGYEA